METHKTSQQKNVHLEIADVVPEVDGVGDK